MADTPDKQESPSPADLTITDLLHMFGRLKAAQLWAVLLAIAGVLTGTFLLGGRLAPKSIAQAHSDLTRVFQRHSAEQQELRERPSIAVFEKFLTNASQERWSEAYSLLASNWKARVSRAEELARDYRMTQRHEFHYYVPVSLTNDRESWDVEFSYWDFFPELAERDFLIRQPLGALLEPTKLATLSDELSRTLLACYKSDASTVSQVHEAVSTFIAREATVRDLVLRDDLVELLGNRLHLTPLLAQESAQGKHPSQERRRMFHVHLLKEGGSWLVDSYDSYLVEKR